MPFKPYQYANGQNFINATYDPNMPNILDKYPELTDETKKLFNKRPDGGYDHRLLQQFGDQVANGIETFKTTFKNQAGRDATAEELNGFLQKSFYQSWIAPGELQYTDLTAIANNYISNNFDVAKLQRERGKSEAPNQYGQVNDIFKSVLGRDADQSEKDHFGQLLASGDLDPYTLSTWVQSLPESVKKQDADFRASLTGDLQKQDVQYLQEQVLPSVQSAFAAQGRDPGSSGFANSLALAAQSQNRDRESFLSNLTASQYMGNKQAAYGDYLNSVGRYQQGQDYSRARAAQLSDSSTNRIYDVQNFNMQRSAYEDYLRRFGKRNSSLGGIGSLAGMGLGALLAAPTGGMSVLGGAMLGGQIGGAGGSLLGY